MVKTLMCQLCSLKRFSHKFAHLLCNQGQQWIQLEAQPNPKCTHVHVHFQRLRLFSRGTHKQHKVSRNYKEVCSEVPWVFFIVCRKFDQGVRIYIPLAQTLGCSAHLRACSSFLSVRCCAITLLHSFQSNDNISCFRISFPDYEILFLF